MKVIDEIYEYKKLFDDGIIDSDEFAKMKATSINNISSGDNDASVLRDVKALLDEGVLTEEEFNTAKGNVLNKNAKRKTTISVPNDIKGKIDIKGINKNKKIIIGIAAILVLLVIIKLVAGGGSKAMPFGFKLGDSFDNTMKLAKSLDTNAKAGYDDDYIYLNTNMFDYEWETELSFIYENGLESMLMETSKTVTKEEYDKVVKKLTKKYGKPARSGKSAYGGYMSIWECGSFEFYSSLNNDGTIWCYFTEPGSITATVN